MFIKKMLVTWSRSYKNKNKKQNKKPTTTTTKRAGEMAQQLRALTALVEDLGSVSSTWFKRRKTPCRKHVGIKYKHADLNPQNVPPRDGR